MKSRGHFKTFNKFNKKKKTFQATWDDSDSFSSDEEEATEIANICFMAQEDEVQDYDELLEAFNELFNNFKNEKIKNKVLIKENERLINENASFVSQTSSLSSQKEDFEKVIASLKKDNEIFLKENYIKRKLLL